MRLTPFTAGFAGGAAAALVIILAIAVAALIPGWADFWVITAGLGAAAWLITRAVRP